jgi:MFS family permease
MRTALFFSAASIAGAFSGLLAFGIAKMDGIGGLHGWQWIFIIEGLLTVVVGVFAFFTLYDFPETAGFLTQEERDFVAFRLKYQGQGKAQSGDDSDRSSRHVQVAQAEEFEWKYVWQACSDWQVWVHVFVIWGVSTTAACSY